jgi:phenylacetate-CoA ligase
MSRAAIEAAQFRRLRALLAAILPSNRFYARKLRPVAARLRRARTLREALALIPFTTKAELTADQAAHPPFGTNLTFTPDRYTRFSQTSGTTDRPLRWLDTPESWDWMVRSWMQVLRAASARRGDRILFAFSFGPFIGFWLAFEAAARLGCLCLPAGGMTSAARARAILDCGATILCCTPTYALRLAEVARQERIPLRRSRVRMIVVAGEPGGSVPAVRARITRAWNGARVFDHHGMTEVGPVTFECPDRPGALAVMEDAYIAEVVDPRTGAEADEGELILTPLGREGSPLLRYRTGDRVRRVFRRSGLVLDGGILGRTDDMVIVRGVNLYPSAVDDVVRRFADVAEYQVKVRRTASSAELSIRAEPAARCASPEAMARRLASALRTAFGLRIPVRPVPRGSLPRFEMKSRRWT